VLVGDDQITTHTCYWSCCSLINIHLCFSTDVLVPLCAWSIRLKLYIKKKKLTSSKVESKVAFWQFLATKKNSGCKWCYIRGDFIGCDVWNKLGSKSPMACLGSCHWRYILCQWIYNMQILMYHFNPSFHRFKFGPRLLIH